MNTWALLAHQKSKKRDGEAYSIITNVFISKCNFNETPLLLIIFKLIFFSLFLISFVDPIRGCPIVSFFHRLEYCWLCTGIGFVLKCSLERKKNMTLHTHCGHIVPSFTYSSFRFFSLSYFWKFISSHSPHLVFVNS